MYIISWFFGNNEWWTYLYKFLESAPYHNYTLTNPFEVSYLIADSKLIPNSSSFY